MMKGITKQELIRQFRSKDSLWIKKIKALYEYIGVPINTRTYDAREVVARNKSVRKLFELAEEIGRVIGTPEEGDIEIRFCLSRYWHEYFFLSAGGIGADARRDYAKAQWLLFTEQVAASGITEKTTEQENCYVIEAKIDLIDLLSKDPTLRSKRKSQELLREVRRELSERELIGKDKKYLKDEDKVYLEEYFKEVVARLTGGAYELFRLDSDTVNHCLSGYEYIKRAVEETLKKARILIDSKSFNRQEYESCISHLADLNRRNSELYKKELKLYDNFIAALNHEISESWMATHDTPPLFIPKPITVG